MYHAKHMQKDESLGGKTEEHRGTGREDISMWRIKHARKCHLGTLAYKYLPLDAVCVYCVFLIYEWEILTSEEG